MKNRRVLTIVLVVVLSTVTLSVSCAEPVARPATTQSVDKPTSMLEDSVFASRRIRITWDKTALPLDRNRIIDLLNRPQHLSEGLPPTPITRIIRSLSLRAKCVTVLSSEGAYSNRGFLLGDYRINLSGINRLMEDTSAPAVLEAVVGRLRKLLREEHKESIRQLEDKCDTAIRAREKAHARLIDIRHRLVAMAINTTGTDVTWKAEKNRALICELERQLRRLDIEMAAKKMRLEAVRGEIADIGRETSQTATAAQRKKIIEELEQKKKMLKELLKIQTEKHPAVKSLRAKIALLEADLKKSEPTAASPVKDDFSEIAAKLEKTRVVLRARLDAAHRKFGPNHRSVKSTEEMLAALEDRFADVMLLAATRRQKRARGDLELAARLKAEQTALIIDSREMEVRWQVMKMQLKQAQGERKKLLARLCDRERLIMKIEHVKTVDLPLAVKQYERAALWADELRQELMALVSPTVTIVK